MQVYFTDKLKRYQVTFTHVVLQEMQGTTEEQVKLLEFTVEDTAHMKTQKFLVYGGMRVRGIVKGTLVEGSQENLTLIIGVLT
jgi:hypothetical protein